MWLSFSEKRLVHFFVVLSPFAKDVMISACKTHLTALLTQQTASIY